MLLSNKESAQNKSAENRSRKVVQRFYCKSNIRNQKILPGIKDELPISEKWTGWVSKLDGLKMFEKRRDAVQPQFLFQLSRVRWSFFFRQQSFVVTLAKRGSIAVISSNICRRPRLRWDTLCGQSRNHNKKHY